MIGCGVCQGQKVYTDEDGKRHPVNATSVGAAVGMTCGEILSGFESLAGYRCENPEPLLPSPVQLENWEDDLQHPAAAEMRDYLRDVRGLTDETVKAAGIGFNWKARPQPRFTLPVWRKLSIHGYPVRLADVRSYDREAVKRKMRGLKACPVSLYPLTDELPPPPLPDRPGVVVCEGEWDCLLLRQHGFQAITTTGGKGAWKSAWSELLSGQHVAFLYDVGADEDALAHARRVWSAGAMSIRVVRLRLPDEGDDVTDWVVREGRSAADLRALVKETAPLAQRGRGGSA